MMLPGSCNIPLGFYVLFWLFLKGSLAAIRAEIIRLSLVLVLAGGSLGINVHATHRIFYHRSHLLSWKYYRAVCYGFSVASFRHGSFTSINPGLPWQLYRLSCVEIGRMQCPATVRVTSHCLSSYLLPGAGEFELLHGRVRSQDCEHLMDQKGHCPAWTTN